MLFNSYAFIFFFLPVTFAVFFVLNRARLTLASRAWLVFCSLFFYSYWNLRFLPLILVSITFNFAAGTALVRSAAEGGERLPRKAVLYASVTLNLLLLGYYKYADFFLSNLNALTGLGLPMLRVVLPLGISFFTFTQIAYLVDCYRRESREYDFLNYILFVTYFPHLIAGPILHHKDLMPQFDDVRKKVINFRNIAAGLYIFSIGLFKKAAVADTFAPWATHGFDQASALSLAEAWITSLSYTLQLYFDFSGYIDMAIGASLLFNIELPINFYSPYKARSIQDFWRRWHITLSRFFRDYIYIPLGGNRRGGGKTSFNLFVTFLLGGLWHGASWTFVFWGALHGAAMVVQRWWSGKGKPMTAFAAWFLTFHFVNLTWVFFRAKSWADAVKVLRGMLGMSGLGLSAGHLSQIEDFRQKALYLIFFFCVVFLAPNTSQLREKFRPSISTACAAFLLAAAGLTCLTRVSEFIYFNF